MSFPTLLIHGTLDLRLKVLGPGHFGCASSLVGAFALPNHPQPEQSAEMRDLPLERLMDVSASSLLPKSQSLSDLNSAVFAINQDIKRAV